MIKIERDIHELLGLGLPLGIEKYTRRRHRLTPAFRQCFRKQIETGVFTG